MSLHRRLARLTAVWLGLCGAFGGCGGGGGTEPITPSTVSLNSPTIAFTAVGQTQQLSATVTDQSGATIPSPALTWASSNPAVATVSATGLVTAVANGSAEITATAGAVSARATVTVAQTPTQLQKAAGDGQSGSLSQTLPLPLTVRVLDAGGAPVPGVTVSFTGTAGDGTLGAASVVTGSDGRAATTFAPVRSGPLRIGAAAVGTALTVTFTETGVSPFAIELQFLTTPTASQMAAFTAARQRWQTLIVGDLPDVMLNAAAGTCGPDSPATQRLVDDVLIMVSIEPIDGPGNILGAAAPCFIRTTGSLTALGRMQFDSEDLALVESAGLLQPVILHEMAHVLGYGTLWPLDGLIADAGGADPHFTGAGAVAEFDAAGGVTYMDGLKVPVENTGGSGTADAHWRESVFGSELMTGFVDNGFNPLSRISVASMQDLGYVVNLADADPYTLGAALRAASRGPSFDLRHDILRHPIRVVNSAGQVLQVLQP